ncbi:hypothetical protein MFFC18_13650 [Mariniblastus fucicola]|uniref:Uncharacterized protein n=2 Tax=Mariniblastus fucicola TaxID=980251 RepID=A0A5B9P7M4_9BACT|nr:hypothetical protein MFFC18_13650 [Mariniblastus fucicola]
MLLMAIVALISTRSFYKTAAANGFHPGKAAGTPMLGLMLVLAINHLLMAASLFVSDRFTISDSTQSWIVTLNGIFVILAYLVFLRENYKVINVTNAKADNSTSPGQTDRIEPNRLSS